MKTKHLKKRVSYFKALRGLRNKDIKQYMAECPDTLIDVICEACFNLCYHHALKDEEITCREREPFNVYLKKLANKKVSVQYKREILQKIVYSHIINKCLCIFERSCVFNECS